MWIASIGLNNAQQGPHRNQPPEIWRVDLPWVSTGRGARWGSAGYTFDTERKTITSNWYPSSTCLTFPSSDSCWLARLHSSDQTRDLQKLQSPSSPLLPGQYPSFSAIPTQVLLTLLLGHFHNERIRVCKRERERIHAQKRPVRCLIGKP